MCRKMAEWLNRLWFEYQKNEQIREALAKLRFSAFWRFFRSLPFDVNRSSSKHYVDLRRRANLEKIAQKSTRTGVLQKPLVSFRDKIR